jgi:hypothetical protein
MKGLIAVALLSGCLGVWGMLYAQQRPGGFGGGQQTPTGSPPPPVGKASSRPHPPDGAIPEGSGKTKRRFDAVVARKDAQELAELAQKIPGQIESVSKNVLPKDLSHQLKQIEKLARSLRSQISP